jgi:integrase
VLFDGGITLGIIDSANPCEGIKGFSEKPRERYVSDDEFLKVHDAAVWFAQDAMDLALLLGQRPADVFKIQLQDVQNDFIAIHQNKTGAKVRIARVGILSEVLTRILNRERLSAHPESQLIVCDTGKPMTSFIFRKAFDKARIEANVSFQFRDLRAKAATDTQDLSWAQKLLGHRSRNTTESYTRDRVGDLVQPLR